MKELLIDRYIIDRKLPVNFVPEDQKLFHHELQKIFGPIYLTTLKEAYVLNDLVFKPFHFYTPQSLSHPMGRKEQFKRLGYFFKTGVSYDKCIWVIDNWSGGYFHWIMDALPRLMICREKMQGHKVLLPEAYRSLSFISITLDMLGFEPVFYEDKCYIKELLLPDHVSVSGNYYPPIFHAIRESLLKNTAPVKPFRKIYVSRNKARFRKLINEEAYTAMLQQHGFEIHFFEHYSLKEQIQLMQETKYFIGLHGNALTNIYFMQPNTKVLELRFADDKMNNAFFSLAAATGVDYYYQVGAGTSLDTHVADMVLDIKKSEKNLALLLSE